MKRVKTISANGRKVTVNILVQVDTGSNSLLRREEVDEMVNRLASKCMIIIPEIPYVHVALSEVKVK